ncbi:MAG TPA: DUF3048 domain-containing protein [Candidatus Limnocylindria bacterium]|nr:DUF3048 domain-containing protein [Candidatus Limnocylindria bacterium]
MDLLRSRTTQVAAAAVLVIAVAGGGWLALGGSPRSTPIPTARSTATPTVTPVAVATATPSASPTPPQEPEPEPEVARCPLTGKPLASRKRLRDPALAVQIENHPLARPVTNLGRADMVIEATVEGDVTRYTGIYLCRKARGVVGPVRSGRYYSIDLWQDMHVLPFMFGAGGEGIRRYHAAHLPYLNGITGGWPYFTRSSARAAPHNLYADLGLVRRDFGHNDRLDALAHRVGDLRAPFRFDAGVDLPGGRRVHRVQLHTNGFWSFGWDWDPDLRAWRRNEGGVEHVDAGTGRVLSATSVVVQFVREDIVYGPHDPGGYPRRYHHLVGSGRATLYARGRAFALHWSRPTAHSRTRWTYVHGGGRVVLPPGVVWREILPVYTTVNESR